MRAEIVLVIVMASMNAYEAYEGVERLNTPKVEQTQKDSEYVCPKCAWTPWKDGPMNRAGTFEPLVAAGRIDLHIQDHEDAGKPVDQSGRYNYFRMGFAAEHALRAREGRLFKRAIFKAWLRTQAVRHADKATRAAMLKVEADADLFDQAFSGTFDEYDAQAGGKIQDFLTFLKEHKEEIIKLILALLSIAEPEQASNDAIPIYLDVLEGSGGDDCLECARHAARSNTIADHRRMRRTPLRSLVRRTQARLC